MSIAFDAYGAGQTEGGNKKSVDWDALNEYVVKEAGIQERVTEVGVISMIVDLGIQKQEDAEMEFDGGKDQEDEILLKFPDTYFKDGISAKDRKTKVRLKCWPQKPVQCVAVAVDFPGITIDKGSFFGDSKPLPLRVWMGGQFYSKGAGAMIVGRPTALKVNKKLGDWSFAQNHMMHRMAVASGLIKPDECFLPKDIGQLLGKSYLFDVQVFFKKGNDGKKYYNEYIKFAGQLVRGMSPVQSPVEPKLVMFNHENDPNAVKEVRSHVVNTMKLADNFSGSALEKQINSRYTDGGAGVGSSDEPKPAKVTSIKPKEKEEQAPNYDSFDDDIPF